MIIGYTIGSATTQEALMLAEKKVRIGTYVVLEYDDMKVLGVITSVNRCSPMLDESVNDVEIVSRLQQLDSNIPHFLKASIKLLCKLDNESFDQPDYPPAAGTKVRLAEEEELKKIFSEGGDIRLGTLVGTNVEVKIKVNPLSRHLAILAATGSGKSNTVAVLTQRLAEIGGTSLIFDYHGEYYNSDIQNINLIEPKINPLKLMPTEFATLLEIPKNAFKQYRLLRRSLKSLNQEFIEQLKSGGDKGDINSLFFDELEKKINEESAKEKSDRKDSKDELLNKIEEFRDKYSNVIDVMAPDVIDKLKVGSVNVVNLSFLDEEAMDAIISHYLRSILEARKEWKNSNHTKGLSYPIVTVIEEAHVFLSKNDNTLTKYWASRIAREGRKFGVSLVIVSQRPKGLDENILSQMTNKIILKIVEPNDKNYILESSDDLSEDLVNQLPSLNVGEAIVIGKIVKLPAIIKIDKFPGKLGGSDPDLIDEWNKALKMSKEKENLARQVLDMGVPDDFASHI